jgi:subtilisin family serine protease
LRGNGWHVPGVAILAALLLNLTLLFVMAGDGSPAMVGAGGVLLNGLSHAHAAALADDGDDGEDKKWEGTLVSYPDPPVLHGTWMIAIHGNQVITVTATPATKFRPKEAANYRVGQWIEVKGKRQPDGTVLAKRIRIDDFEAGEIVVRLRDATYIKTLEKEHDLNLRSVLLESASIYLFATKDEEEDEVEAATAIDDEEGVIWAEVNYVHSVPEEDGYKTWGWGGTSEPDEYSGQSAYQQIHWGPDRRAYTGEGIVVAVLDTGVYTLHEQFAGKLQLPSLDVIGDDDDPSESGPGIAWGHGTHVAGVIAAMSPAARILPVRVLDEDGRGNTFLLAYAIEWAAQQAGVKVINLSLGTDSDSKILRDVIAETAEQGIVVVAAAGNTGTSKVQYPAGYDGVIGVTAVDRQSHKASFANFGKGWVDIAAPGVGIMSTMINQHGPGYATWSGTSMSTAFVSGAAALVAAKMQSQPSLSEEVANQLLATALEIDSLNPPEYAGKIGRLLNVRSALGVEDRLLFLPSAMR